MANGQISAAVSAIKEKGVLIGKRIERQELGRPGEFETMTDDELERAFDRAFQCVRSNARCRK
jgi:hypothetical protein